MVGAVDRFDSGRCLGFRSVLGRLGSRNRIGNGAITAFFPDFCLYLRLKSEQSHLPRSRHFFGMIGLTENVGTILWRELITCFCDLRRPRPAATRVPSNMTAGSATPRSIPSASKSGSGTFVGTGLRRTAQRASTVRRFAGWWPSGSCLLANSRCGCAQHDAGRRPFRSRPATRQPFPRNWRSRPSPRLCPSLCVE